MDIIILGKRIREERKKKSLTQEQLAELSGISVAFLGHIERGTRRASVETLVAIANALKASTDYLLGRTTMYDALLEKKPEHQAILHDVSRLVDQNWGDWFDFYEKIVNENKKDK